MKKEGTDLVRLVGVLQPQIERVRPRPKNELLQNVAALWHEYQRARRNVVERLADETLKTEHILRVAQRRGLLLRCIHLDMLPTGAENFLVNDGAAFHANYATLAEHRPAKSLIVQAGAVETNRRRH